MPWSQCLVHYAIQLCLALRCLGGNILEHVTGCFTWTTGWTPVSECLVWLVWWLPVHWQRPRSQGVGNDIFILPEPSLGPWACVLLSLLDRDSPDIWELFPSGDYSPKYRQENQNQAKMFQPKQAVAWGSAVWSAAFPPNMACAGLLQSEVRSGGCSAGWTSAVFTGWSSYYHNCIKGIMPVVKLSQTVTLLKSLFCAEGTAQDPDLKRCHVSSKNNSNLLNWLNICQFLLFSWSWTFRDWSQNNISRRLLVAAESYSLPYSAYLCFCAIV